MTRRREFIAMLGGAVVSGSPYTVLAQTPRRHPLIGCLGAGMLANNMSFISAFFDGLRELGYIEGESFDIEYRFAEGHFERLPGLANELARLKPDLILATVPDAALAAKQAAPSVPIVSPVMLDPVHSGLISSYAHPGGTVTGILDVVEGLTAKQLEIALEIVPGTNRVGLLVNVENSGSGPQRQEIEAAGAAHGIGIIGAEIHKSDDLASAFRALVGENVRVVIVLRDALIFSQRQRVAELAVASRLPTLFGFREHVEAGGLISYGVSVSGNFRRAAVFVDKILKGARPSDLPVEFPTKLEMLINIKTAKALGLTIPPTLLARADEVIE